MSEIHGDDCLSDNDYSALWKTLYELGEEWIAVALNTPLCDIPFAPPLPKEVKVCHLKYVLNIVPDILPSALYIEYRNQSQLKAGDIIVIKCVWGWQTYAMVSNTTRGAKTVICFVNQNGQPVSDVEALLGMKPVTLGEVGMEEVLEMEYGPVAIIRQSNKTRSLSSARSILGQNWSFFQFNSEHFATWALTGEAQCQQLLNLRNKVQRHVLTGALTGVATQEGCNALKNCAKFVFAQTTKEAAEEVVSGTAKAAAKQLTKETAEETVSKVASASLGQKLVSGAKAGLFAGTIVEGACLAYSVHGAYKQMKKGDISGNQFRHHVVQHSGAAGGSVAGGAVGAAVGTVLIPIPVVGTIVGSVVGGVAGSLIGSKVGDAADKMAFGEKCD